MRENWCWYDLVAGHPVEEEYEDVEEEEDDGEEEQVDDDEDALDTGT